MIDLRASIPVFISITEGKVHDVNALDDLVIEPGSIYALDRGYVDFARLFRLHSDGGFFVTRAKKNMVFNVCESRPVDKTTGLRCDQTIRLKTKKSKKDYPAFLRRVSYADETSGKRLVFLSNSFHLPAIKIAEIYKGRWHIELFFKWIKQNLRIKTFFGNNEIRRVARCLRRLRGLSLLGCFGEDEDGRDHDEDGGDESAFVFHG